MILHTHYAAIYRLDFISNQKGAKIACFFHLIYGILVSTLPLLEIQARINFDGCCWQVCTCFFLALPVLGGITCKLTWNRAWLDFRRNFVRCVASLTRLWAIFLYCNSSIKLIRSLHRYRTGSFNIYTHLKKLSNSLCPPGCTHRGSNPLTL
jgi:hypothetical protein